MHPQIFALLKFGLFFGTVLLIGSGVFARWVGRELEAKPIRDRLGLAMTCGAGLVVLVGVLDLGFTAYNALGELDLRLYWAYLMGSRHGNSVMARIGLAIALVGMGAGISARPAVQPSQHSFGIKAKPALNIKLEPVVFVAMSLAFLYTITLTSHAGGTGRIGAILTDVIHLGAMGVWAGAVLGLAFLPIWTAPLRLPMRALERTSELGLLAVGVLTVTGLIVSLERIFAPSVLTGTAYGQALGIKLGLVALTVGLAASHRFTRLPELRRLANKGVEKQAAGTAIMQRFQNSLRLEAVLLVAVLGATGWLTNQVPPERGVRLAEPVPVEGTTGPFRLQGSFSSGDTGGTILELRVQDEAGNKPPPDFALRVRLDLLDHAMQPIVLRQTSSAPGAYRFEGSFWMGGNWRATITTPLGQIKVALTPR